MQLTMTDIAPKEHLFTPDPANQRVFRHALGAFTTGVTVVSVMTPGGPTGMTVNSFASVSLDPPLVLWSAARSSARHGLFTSADHYAIHVLGADQHQLSARFTRGGMGFEGLDWEENEDGVPILSGTLARFECRRYTLHEAGDHTIVIGCVLRAAHREGEPLCFSRGIFGRFAGKR
jgi:flavin reductase (DIM6/NTAB) family NADH-FMN oxidoreductase RutF